jgi:hypothetical protein
MAIAYHSSTPFSSTSALSVYSFSHAAAFGGVLLVCIGTDQNGSESISGVTYDGVACTRAGSESTKIQLNGGGPNSRTSIWYLGSPNLGTNTVEITASGALVGIHAVALNYTGVDHTTPVSHSAADFSDSGYAVPPGTAEQHAATSVTSVNGEIVVGCVTWFSDLTPQIAAGSGETSRLEQSLAGANPRFLVTEKAGSTGTVTLDDVINTNDPSDYSWTSSAVSLTVGSATTYNPRFYREITVDHTKVGATQTDHPVLISGTFAYLKTVGNGGKVQSSSGYDILFFSDASLTTLLPFEISKWDGATGDLIAYTKIASLSSVADTVFYMAYDDTGISSDQSNKTAVYRSTIKGVWHLQEAASPALDSTSTGASGTQTGGVTFAATGQVGKACTFDGTNDRLAMSQASTFNYARTDAFSGMAWINTTNNANAQNIIGNSDNGGGRNGWEFSVGDAGTGMLRVGIYANVNSSQFLRVRSTNNVIASSTLKHVAFTYSGNSLASGVKIYVNGAAVATTTEDDTLGANSISASGQPLYVSSRTAATNFFGGTIDEPKTEKVEWTANQILTFYNNELSPSTFNTVSSEFSTGLFAPTLTGIAPVTGEQGLTVAVVLTGTNFDQPYSSGDALVAISGANVTVSGTTIVNSTTINVNFVIGGSAATTARTVTVQTDEGTTSTATFTITAAAGGTATAGTSSVQSSRRRRE